jgi:antirestriction protein ArdC
MFNYVTKQSYSGGNAIALAIAADESGYSSPYWMTFRQAIAEGFSVKGAKGHGVCIKRIVAKKIIDQATKQEKKIQVPKTYVVFNLDVLRKAEEIV